MHTPHFAGYTTLISLIVSILTKYIAASTTTQTPDVTGAIQVPFHWGHTLDTVVVTEIS